MFGPRVMFASGPAGWCGESPEMDAQSLNDFVGGFVQNLIDPTTAAGRGAGSSGCHRPFGSAEGCRRGRPNVRAQWFGPGFGPGPSPWSFGNFGPFGQEEGFGGCNMGGGWFSPQSCSKGCPDKSKCGEKSARSGQTKCPGQPTGKASKSDRENKNTKGTNKTPPTDNNNPLAECFKKCQEHFSKVLQTMNSQWAAVVSLEGFSAEEIKVKVDDNGGVARIHALHESGDGENFDRREAERVVKLPEDVLTDSIKVSYRPNGTVLVVGKREVKTAEESEREIKIEGREAAKEENSRSEDSPLKEKEEKSGQTEDDSTTSVETSVVKSEENPAEESRLSDVTKTALKETKQSRGADETHGSGTVTFPSDDESDDVSKTFIMLPRDKEGDLEEREEPFSLELDVSKFSPDQVSVRVSGNLLTVTAEDREEEQDGYSSLRKLQRSYTLPDNVDPESLKSTIGSDGVLKVLAPENPAVEVPQEKSLSIEME